MIFRNATVATQPAGESAGHKIAIKPVKVVLAIAALSVGTVTPTLIHAADQAGASKQSIQKAPPPPPPPAQSQGLKDDWLGNSIFGAAGKAIFNVGVATLSGLGVHVAKEAAAVGTEVAKEGVKEIAQEAAKSAIANAPYVSATAKASAKSTATEEPGAKAAEEAMRQANEIAKAAAAAQATQAAAAQAAQAAAAQAAAAQAAAARQAAERNRASRERPMLEHSHPDSRDFDRAHDFDRAERNSRTG